MNLRKCYKKNQTYERFTKNAILKESYEKLTKNVAINWVWELRIRMSGFEY